MRLRIAVILAVCAALAVTGGTLYAQQKSAMIGGAHDLRAAGNSTGDWCKACHVPHGSSTVHLGLLWNHGLSEATYSVWNTTDMPDYKGGTTQISNTSASSGLCLSCHDGTVATNVLISNNNAADANFLAMPLSSTSNLGADLRNDHPVGFVYKTSADAKNTLSPGNLAAPSAVVTAGLKLFGTSADTGTMECSTCHEVHAANTVAYFLRKANTNSALCLTCHL